MSSGIKRKKETTPPEGYLCNICQSSGHWIQQCPDRVKHNAKKKQRTHIPVPGVDPSQTDIETARQYQQIPSPPCFCGNTSRLKKVKQSKVKENSRAVGNYFFFCATRKDANPCRFARPVEEVLKEQKRKTRRQKAKKPAPDESPPAVSSLNSNSVEEEVAKNIEVSKSESSSSGSLDHDKSGSAQEEEKDTPDKKESNSDPSSSSDSASGSDEDEE